MGGERNDSVEARSISSQCAHHLHFQNKNTLTAIFYAQCIRQLLSLAREAENGVPKGCSEFTTATATARRPKVAAHPLSAPPPGAPMALVRHAGISAQQFRRTGGARCLKAVWEGCVCEFGVCENGVGKFLCSRVVGAPTTLAVLSLTPPHSLSRKKAARYAPSDVPGAVRLRRRGQPSRLRR